MTDSQTPPARTPAPADAPVRGWALIATLTAFAVLVLAAASLAWAGVAIIIALLFVAYAVLIRWSR